QITEAVARARDRRYPITLAQALNTLSQLRRRQGRLDESTAAAAEALELSRANGTVEGSLHALSNLSSAAEQAGDRAEARRRHKEPRTAPPRADDGPPRPRAPGCFRLPGH